MPKSSSKFHVASVVRPKRVAKALCDTLKARGYPNFPYQACLDIVARMYGFSDCNALFKSAGTHPASLDDSISSTTEVEARRLAHARVLTEAGVKAADVDAVLDLVRPTCRADLAMKPVVDRTPIPQRMCREIFDGVEQKFEIYELKRRLLRFSRGHDPAEDGASSRRSAWENSTFGSFLSNALADNQDVDLFIKGLADFHDRGVTARFFIGCIASPIPFLKYVAETESLKPDHARALIEACRKFRRAMFASHSRAPSDEMMKEIETFDLDHQLSMHLFAQCGAVVDNLVEIQNSFLQDIFAIEKADADLRDLAVLVAYSNEEFPDVIDEEIDDYENILGNYVALKDMNTSYFDSKIKINVKDILRLGMKADFHPISLCVDIHNSAVRLDSGEFVLSFDVLSAAAESGWNLADLADVVAFNYSVEAGSKPIVPKKGVDKSLAAIFLYLDDRSESETRELVKTLRRLHAESYGIYDFLANLLVWYGHPDFSKDIDSDDPSLLTPIVARSLEEMVFAPSGIPEYPDAGHGFSMLEAVLGMSGNGIEQLAEFLENIILHVEPLLEDTDYETATTARAAARIDNWENRIGPSPLETMNAISDFAACAAEARDERRAIECLALNAAFVIGISRFVVPVSDDAVFGGISLSEMSYLALGALDRRLRSSNLEDELTADEKRIVAAARHTLELIRILVWENKSRAKEIEKFRDTWTSLAVAVA